MQLISDIHVSLARTTVANIQTLKCRFSPEKLTLPFFELMFLFPGVCPPPPHTHTHFRPISPEAIKLGYLKPVFGPVLQANWFSNPLVSQLCVHLSVCLYHQIHHKFINLLKPNQDAKSRCYLKAKVINKCVTDLMTFYELE